MKKTINDENEIVETLALDEDVKRESKKENFETEPILIIKSKKKKSLQKKEKNLDKDEIEMLTFDEDTPKEETSKEHFETSSLLVMKSKKKLDKEKKDKKNKEKHTKSVKTKEKRKMHRGEKTFFFVNLFIIIGILGFYAYRTIYYYKISHVIVEEITIKDKIVSFGSVVYQNDGLYEKDNKYFFKGTDVNNYLFYSGRMFRIIEVNKGIKAIEEETSTNLVWGVNTEYKDSIIHGWLTERYLNSLKDYEAYLKKNTWCNETIDIENYECKGTIKDFVGLLSTEEYLRAGGKNSYLNNSTYFWTINQDDDGKALYINGEGSINNLNAKDENYYSYGIRGVVTFRDDLLLVSGEGTKEDPYIIEEETGVLVKDKAVGSYINYGGEKFRILNVDEDGVELLLDGLLENDKNYNEVLNYLNNDYVNKFNRDELIKINYGKGEYNYHNNYNVNRDKNDSYYAVIPSIGDLFLNEYSNYWLSNAQDYGLSLYYTLDDNQMFFGDLHYNAHKVRPIIKIKGDLIVNNGIGTKDNPYVIGDENVEEN